MYAILVLIILLLVIALIAIACYSKFIDFFLAIFPIRFILCEDSFTDFDLKANRLIFSMFKTTLSKNPEYSLLKIWRNVS